MVTENIEVFTQSSIRLKGREGIVYAETILKAVELINTLKPSVAIPTHYGSIVGKKEDADKFAANVKPPVRVEKKMLD